MAKKEAEVVEVVAEDKKTTNSQVLITIYLLYKLNAITPHGLKQVLSDITKPIPDDLAGWLLKEAAKASS